MREQTSIVRPLNPAYIAVPPERLRKLRPEVVDELAESIQRQGLLQPIVVRRKGTGYTLVAGRHRLEAVLQLELDSVLTVILDGLPAAEAELAEIDENLVRAELSPIERDLHIARRKQLYEKQHPETKHGGDRKSAKAKSRSQNENLKAFVEDTAAKTKKSRATVARSAARGVALAAIPNATDAVGTSLDAPGEIEALANLPPGEQQSLIARAQAGEKVSAKPPKPSPIPTEEEAGKEYQETLFDQACRFLESMTDETRQRFFAHIERKYPSPPSSSTTTTPPPRMSIEELEALGHEPGPARKVH